MYIYTYIYIYIFIVTKLKYGIRPSRAANYTQDKNVYNDDSFCLRIYLLPFLSDNKYYYRSLIPFRIIQ